MNVPQSKDTVKMISDVLAEPVSMDDAPTDEWKCPNCGSKNHHWIPTVAAILGGPGDKWRPGMCENCRVREQMIVERQAQYEAKEERKQRILTLHKRASLPEEMARVKFSELTIRTGAEEAFEELSSIDVGVDRNWLCLYGDNNTGKSKLLAATSNRQIGRFVPTLYLNESLFFKQIRESWDNRDESEGDIMAMFRLADVVLWDEFLFFNYMERSWIYERVYAILEYLAEQNKKVVFATNITNIRTRDCKDPSLTMEGRCGKRVFARLQRRNTRYIMMRNVPFY